MGDPIRQRLVRPSRNLKGGIIGLANAGKTSIFNLLSGSCAPTDINVFCTIDPNYATSVFFDESLDTVARIYNSKKTVHSYVSLLDTSGLVRGAHMDEGIGNDFLSLHQPMDILIHVVRAFVDGGITHVEETVDPARDIELVNDELIAKDIEIVNFALSTMEYNVVSGDSGRELLYEFETLSKVYAVLSGKEYVPKKTGPGFRRKGNKPVKPGTVPEEAPEPVPGRPVRLHEWDKNQRAIISKYDLLTAKEMVYIVNISMRDYLRGESPWMESVQEVTERYGGGRVIPLSVQFERHYREQMQQEGNHFEVYLRANPTHKSALGPIFGSLYRQLDLIRFYTASSEEAKVWYIPQGSTAPEAGALIHTSIERDFICASAMTYDDLVELGSEEKVRRVGKLLQQGKKYVVNDGDILSFQYNK